MADHATLLDQLRARLSTAGYAEPVAADDLLAREDAGPRERLLRLLDELDQGVVTAIRSRAASIRILSRTDAGDPPGHLDQGDIEAEPADVRLPLSAQPEQAVVLDRQADALETRIQELRSELDADG